MPTIAQALADATNQLTQTGGPFEIAEKSFAGHNYRVYKNTPATVRELLDVARDHGDACFLDYQGEQWTFKRFFQQVDTIACQLVHRYQVQPGDRIAIAMRNYPEWMTAFTAIVSLGAIAVPLNSWGQKDELEYGLVDAGAGVVFCDQQRFEFIAALLPAINAKAIVVRSTAAARIDLAVEPGYAETFEQFIDGVSNVEMPLFEVDSESPVMILYTSGTTGKPKGAISNHRNIIQAIYNFEVSAMTAAMVNAKTIEAIFAKGNPFSALLAVPLFHVSGLYALFLLSLRGGRKLVMMHKWDPAEALRLIEKQKITTLSVAPNMLMDVVNHPDFDTTDTSSLFALGSGGAATPAHFKELLYQKFDNPYPGTGYGMTENNATCAFCSGEAFRYKPNASGTLSPIVDAKTCDQNGMDLPAGSKGEIYIKSPTVVQGYWNNPQASKDIFTHGWLRTGDIGYIDDENFIFLIDRAKDIIIRGGENISAAEIESCLSEHPAVREGAAFSLPDDAMGEIVAVAIQCNPDQQIDTPSIQQHIREQLAAFKVPSVVVFYSEPLPRNAAGKVLKKVIRDRYLDK